MLKNNRGQVLLVVMLFGMIALIITMGMVARVSRLTKTVVQTEQHEAAFSTSEKYSRRILDRLRNGEDPAVFLPLLNIEANGEGTNIERVNSFDIKGAVLSGFETYEIAYETAPSGTLEISFVGGFPADTKILITVIRYGSSQYSVNKRLFSACNSGSGDLSGINCSGNKISYTLTGNDKSIRVRPIGGSVELNFTSSTAIADKYIITSTESEEGATQGVQSETTLYVPKTKVMPTLFDFVLFNGTGQIVKS